MQSFHIITIEKIVPGAFGLGRLPDGMVALVRYALPGERVLIRPIRKKKRYMEAALIEVLDGSPFRIKPDCHLFENCGGCDLQHTKYHFQLELKKQMLVEHLARDPIITEKSSTKVMSPLPSPKEYGYRQRIRLHVDTKGRLGFYRQQTNKIISVVECPLAMPIINKCLLGICGTTTLQLLLKNTEALELLVNPDCNKVVLIFHFLRKSRPRDRQAAQQMIDSFPEIQSIIFSARNHGLFEVSTGSFPKGKPSVLQQTIKQPREDLPELFISWEAGGFCQVNLEQNNAMIKQVFNWAQATAQDHILDLYCGMGNFSLPLALSGARLLGLDGKGASIRSARNNILLNTKNLVAKNEHLSVGFLQNNLQFEKTSVLEGVRKLYDSGEKFDIVVLDPPRQGAYEIIPYFAKLNACRLLYISCDPATMVRDLSKLIDEGYQLRGIQPVDMFPQTHHLETITLLEKD